MKTLRQSGKILISLLFTLTIVFCCVCADSYATGHNSLTGFSAGVASITVSGGTVAQEVTPVISGDQYTYNIAITEDWNSLNSNKKITIKTKMIGNIMDILTPLMMMGIILNISIKFLILPLK